MKVKSTKPVYTISIAAELTNTHPRTLMLYESKGVLSPFRTATNRRLYSSNNINEIKFIQYLTQNKGINLAGVRHILEAIKLCKKQKVDLEKELFADYEGTSPF